MPRSCTPLCEGGPPLHPMHSRLPSRCTAALRGASQRSPATGRCAGRQRRAPLGCTSSPPNAPPPGRTPCCSRCRGQGLYTTGFPSCQTHLLRFHLVFLLRFYHVFTTFCLRFSQRFFTGFIRFQTGSHWTQSILLCFVRVSENHVNHWIWPVAQI